MPKVFIVSVDDGETSVGHYMGEASAHDQFDMAVEKYPGSIVEMFTFGVSSNATPNDIVALVEDGSWADVGTLIRHYKPSRGVAKTNETNEEFIVRMMNFAKSGPLMQAFIIEGLSRYADNCAKQDPKAFDSGFLSGAAWHACAVELKAEIDAKYNRSTKQ